MGKVDRVFTQPSARQALGESHSSVRSTRSAQGREARWRALPQATERTPQAVEWDCDATQMSARPMTEVTQKPESQRPIARPQQMQEKGIGQCRQSQELQALLEAPQPRTLKGEFAFIIAPSQFDLPAAHLRKHYAPGVLIAGDGISGQEIPGGAAFATADHQPQGRVAMVGMTHVYHFW